MTPSATVIVPTIGRLSMHPEVLDPLLADPACAELLVVMQGAQPATVAALRDRATDSGRLRWIVNEQPGAGGMFGRHQGAVEASHEVLVFIDDDVIAEPGLVSGHVLHHQSDPSMVVLGYMPVPPEPAGWRPSYPVRLYAEAYEWLCGAFDADPGEVLLNFWAGNHSLRRDDALRLGSPPESMTSAYHADREFGLRARAIGLKPRFDRGLRAHHLYRRTVDQFVGDCRRMGAGGRLVHELHVTQVGALPVNIFEQGLPARSLPLLRACRAFLPLSGPVSAGLRAGAWLSAALRRSEHELLLGRVLRSVEQQRGMLGDLP